MIKYKVKSSKPHSLLHLILSLFSLDTLSLLVGITSIVYGVHYYGPYGCCLLSIFVLHVIFFLTSIIVYGLFSLIIFWFVYICGIFSLFLIYHDFFFFLVVLVYICVTFFETYSHIFMVINCKLVINNDILKNIPAQNRSNRTLCTTPHMWSLNWGVVLCGDDFGQITPQTPLYMCVFDYYYSLLHPCICMNYKLMSNGEKKVSL